MEGCDRAQGGKIKEKNPIIERDLIIEKRKNIIALRTVIVTKSKGNLFKNYSSQILPKKNFFA